MRKQFRAGSATMGRFRCCELNEEGHERCLAGELGEIWEAGGHYQAFKVLPSGDEKIFRFEPKDLAKWVLRLKVPADPEMQAYWANHPNERFERMKRRQSA